MKYTRNMVRGLVDGTLVALGVMLGASVSGNSMIVIIAVIGGGIADMIGNLTSALTAESASFLEEVKDLEKKMLVKRKELMAMRYFSGGSRDSYKRSLCDMGATFVGVFLMLLPFLFLELYSALIVSLSWAIIMLFAVGVIIGKITKTSMIKLGLRTAALGLLALVVIFFITRWLGVRL